MEAGGWASPALLRVEDGVWGEGPYGNSHGQDPWLREPCSEALSNQARADQPRRDPALSRTGARSD